MNIIQIPKYNNSLKDKKCVVCGSPAFAHFQGSPYCRKHYMQMKRGGVKDRTTRDPNELIDMGSCIKIVLYNRLGLKIDDFGIIDDDCVKLIQGKKIGYGKFGDKKYCYINIKGKPILLHRYIWEELKGKIPQGKVVDHINGNGLDCRISNLRLASSLENSYNLGKENKYTGVNPYGKDKFSARIMHDRKDYNLGVYPSVQDALKARIEAERKYFGDFGPNVSRFDRGLINYSSLNNFSGGSRYMSKDEIRNGIIKERDLRWSGDYGNMPTKNDLMMLVYPEYYGHVMASANMKKINTKHNDGGFTRFFKDNFVSPIASGMYSLHTSFNKSDYINRDFDRFILSLEGLVGRNLTDEEKNLLKLRLDPERLDSKFDSLSTQHAIFSPINAAARTADIVSLKGLAKGAVKGVGKHALKQVSKNTSENVAKKVTNESKLRAIALPATVMGADVFVESLTDNVNKGLNEKAEETPLSEEHLRALTSDRGVKLEPQLWNSLDVLRIVAPELYDKLFPGYVENRVKNIENLRRIDSEREKEEKKEEEKEEKTNIDNKNAVPANSTNEIPQNTSTPVNKQVSNETKPVSTFDKVAFPTAMAGLALGGYMLYKKNKEKKEKKKQYIDEE